MLCHRLLVALVVVLLDVSVQAPLAAQPSSETVSRLPMWFECNVGQASGDTLFLNRGPGHLLSVTASDATLSLTSGFSVKMALLDAGQSAIPKGGQSLESQAHYFVGSVPSFWHIGVPMYDRVVRPEVYPGIDQVFHGTQRELEYDFVVKPGADPACIRIRYSGADTMKLTPDGDLLLAAKAGQVVHRAPVACLQTEHGPQPVACQYVVQSDGTVAFAVAPYDRSQTLVIDPVVVFSTSLGDRVSGRGVGTDAQGNIYVSGFVHSLSVPSMNAYQPENKGGLDIFVIKLNPAADKVLYATYIGGREDDDSKAMTVDAEGNVYLGGRTKSDDFPTTEGAIMRTHQATFDNIIAKLAPSGDRLLYSTYLGGESMEEIRGIAIDPKGNCAVVGGTHSTDFPTTLKAFKPQYTDTKEPDPQKKSGKPFTAEDAFVAKLNPTGTALVFCSFLGGHGYDKAWGCAMDAEGAVYVTGYSGSKDFPVTPGVVQPRHAGGDPKGDFGELDAFVTKFVPDGSRLAFSTLLGGAGGDKGEGIRVDAQGNVFVGGDTESTDFPIKDAVQPKHGGGKSDAFLAKLSPGADKILWSTYLGGNGDDTVASHALAVDKQGDIYLAGTTNSADLPAANAFQPRYGGGDDAFVCMLTAAGKTGYLSYLGGQEDDSVSAITVDAEGSAYVAGTAGSEMIPSMKSIGAPQQGKRGLFVMKIAAQK